MDKTAIQTSAPPLADGAAIQASVGPTAGPPVTVTERRTVAEPLWKRVLRPLASLRLTVVLFALAIFLVFAGTLAQVDGGIWTILQKYFRTPIAWIPFQVFVQFGQIFLGLPSSWEVGGSFPFPGGQLLGSVLLLNLIAAHLVRFKLSWKRSGILLIHGGLIIMMLGELVTTYFAVESNMVIAEGESVNFVDITRQMELAVIDRNGKETAEVTVPEKMLRDQAEIRHDELPFDVVVEKYMLNSRLLKVEPGEANLATAGDGRKWKAVDRGEVSGVDPNQSVDVASAYVTFKEKGSGKPLGTYLVSLFFYTNATQRQLPDLPQKVAVGDKTYDVYLRFKRAYKPYTLNLIDFRHDRFIGTTTPKNYSSQVRLMDPGRDENREVLIRMNHPLYYRGETFFQSSFLSGDTGTILQVVENPGWLMPYLAFTMVVLGMLVHFSTHLIGFLGQRAVK